MMTIYEKYHPYTPVALWVGGLLVFGATLGTGVATIGSDADAMSRPKATVSMADERHGDDDCAGVIFRDADPSCFAVRIAPYLERTKIPVMVRAAGEAAGS